MNDYELPSFDDDEPTPAAVAAAEAQVEPFLEYAPPEKREIFKAVMVGETLAGMQQFDTSTSVHTIPERMTAVPIKCRCGGKLGYRDPNTPRIWCGGCGRNL